MRGQAMKRICDKLINNGFRLDKYIALEFFAREGNWQTKSFSKLVKTLYAWEIDKKFKDQLLLNHPNANIRIGDSFNISRELKYKSFFDFIVIDNPQGEFNGYCEHFEALNRVNFLLKNSGKLFLMLIKSLLIILKILIGQFEETISTAEMQIN